MLSSSGNDEHRMSSLNEILMSISLDNQMTKPPVFRKRSGGGFVAPVQGVRVFLSCMILVAHNIRPSLSMFTSRDLLLGRVCVAYFFVMAGYFSYVSLYSRRNKASWFRTTLSFYAARMIPAIVAMGLAIIVCILVDPQGFPYGQIFSFKGNLITCMWPMHLGLETKGRFFNPNPALWYLSIQMLFWVLTPLLQLAITRLHLCMSIGLIPFLSALDIAYYVSYPENVQSLNLMIGAYCTPLIWIAKHLQGMLLARSVFELRERFDDTESMMEWIEQWAASLLVGVCQVVSVFAYWQLPDWKHWAYPYDQEPCFFIHPFFLPMLAVWGLIGVPTYSVISRILACRWFKRIAPGSTNLLIYVLHLPFFELVKKAPLHHEGAQLALGLMYITALTFEQFIMSKVQTQVLKFI